jgi:outer membrane protein OmpA-like peptidoglycan-associated protein
MLAYVAHRRTLSVVAEAGIAAAHNDKVAAEREYEEALESSVQRSRDKLGKTEKTLEQARAELQQQQQELREKQNTLKTKDAELAKEKAARTDAERKLAAAMKSLEEVAKVKEDARGTIITLSGAVLFRSSESALLPIAESQLQKVADALEAYEHGRTIIVAGHTDSIGPANANTMLSQARAESVRDFLVEHGVPADRIRAVGKGEDEPIADNKTPEGRANNRRVEIIVEPTKPR